MSRKNPHRPRLTPGEWKLVIEERNRKSGKAEYNEAALDATAVATSSNHVKTLEELLDACNVDQSLWDVVAHNVNKWDMTTKAGLKYQNFSVKATLKKRIDVLDFDKFKSELKDELRKYAPKFRESQFAAAQPGVGNLCEINIFDLHHGQMCWVDATGMHWDLFTSEAEFMQAVQHLIAKSKLHGVSRFLFPIGNDFFNTNTHAPTPTTTKGTPQQDDYRWQETFKTGRKMIIAAIELMRQVAPVDVIVIPGNHDTEKSFYLGDVIEVRYEDSPDVTVNNSPETRKYYQWGNALIGFTHGTSRNETIHRLHHTMSHRPEWATSKFREWHLGDRHHKKTLQFVQEEDEQGVTVKYLRSLIAVDQYHFDKAYNNQIRGAEAHVWTPDRGLEATINYNITPQ